MLQPYPYCFWKHFPFAFWDPAISSGLLLLIYYTDMMVTHDKVNLPASSSYNGQGTLRHVKAEANEMGHEAILGHAWWAV
jgi:lipid-A-disaccharide synthase-like uncharacterized protein